MSVEPIEEDGEGDELVPLSALQHWVVCPRQCCLIHLEQQWAENLATAEGRLLHERVHELGRELRRGVRVVTSMPLRSRALGLVGVADLVELHRMPDGRWRPYPVEFKRGRPKPHEADQVQLCAQAMALEEMFGISVPEGALYYGKQRRRRVVHFDDTLRARTRAVANEVRIALAAGQTPPPIYDKSRCDPCSLIHLCHPRALSGGRRLARWLARWIEEDVE